MAINQDELDRFHQFASKQLGNGEVDDLYDLVDQWETDQLTDDQLNRNAKAIQKGIDEMDAGDVGRRAREIIAEICSKTPS